MSDNSNQNASFHVINHDELKIFLLILGAVVVSSLLIIAVQVVKNHKIDIESQALGVTTIDVGNKTASVPDNILTSSPGPTLAGDLARGKPAFASSYWEEGYPSLPTFGKGAWRSAGSDGSWFYVDLESPKTFRTVVSTLFVDSAFGPSPITTYLISNDRYSWLEVYREKNRYNAEKRGQPRYINLEKPVTARYVGLFGTKWDGGWADLSTFAVLP